MTAMTNPQVMDYARNVAQTAQQNLQTQMSDLDKALVMDQGGINVGDRQALARLMEQVPGLMGATAYHGTPHTIRGKFDISKVGTGEGAQAYGHGMYFAENPEVAKSYANLGTGNIAYRGHTEDVLNKLQKAGADYNTADLISTFVYEGGYKGGTSKDLAKFLKSYADTPEEIKLYKDLTSKPEVVEAINSYVSPKQANLYKVDIPDEYIPTMMDYDKPLGQQSAVVKKALNEIKKQITPEMKMELGGDMNLLFGKDVTPVQFLNTMEIIHPTGGVGIGEKMLNDLGVKGIRYKDAMSRGADKGTSNFVVFDPTDVKILEKNSQKVEGLLD
jgi:hypothetical protein